MYVAPVISKVKLAREYTGYFNLHERSLWSIGRYSLLFILK
jgi:hypothetical protein